MALCGFNCQLKLHCKVQSILTVQKLSTPIKGIESLIKSDDPVRYQVGSSALGSPEENASALKCGPQKGGVATY